MLAKIAACGEVDVDRAVASARAAFDAGAWSRIDPADRKSILFAFADLIEAHADELAITEAVDAGKPIARVRVAPRPGRLRELAGAVPTPHGLVEVRIAGADAEIESPVPVLVVREDGTEVEPAPGTHRVTVRSATP